MRFILDTNIIIPLEQSQQALAPSLANFVRLAHENQHQLIYHPATEDDIHRDNDPVRKQQTLERLRQYTRLEARPECPWNEGVDSPNEIADNEILYAVFCDAAHALVTEDHGIHRKAKQYGISDRVYYIQTADDWLKRLHRQIPVQLPNIQEVMLFNLTQQLASTFFDSLREGYPTFDDWFRKKARDGVKAWVVREEDESLGAICIFDIQTNEQVTHEGLVLNGSALKLCTFKVSETMRGRKIGELFLKAAFRYASSNSHENIFIHGDYEKHGFLFDLLEDFGFKQVGTHPGQDRRDVVYVKEHPATAPDVNGIDPFEYLKNYFPHYLKTENINKFIVPIQPQYHQILFPDFMSEAQRQLLLFNQPNFVGNAIKLAYLCHAQTKQIKAGDIVLFYRSLDDMALTSIGIVELYEELRDPMVIAQKVSRRTVYSMEEIINMAQRNTKVMLFRLVGHFQRPISYGWLTQNNVVNGAIQSIRKIEDQAFESVINHAGI